MPANDREVFDYLTSDPETSPAIDFLTYALFADDKKEWMKHWEDQHGSPPTQPDIDNWISNLSKHHFDRLRERAITFFDAAAADYMAEETERLRTDILETTIVREVKAASNVWRQLGLALITSLLVPFIIGGVIALGLIYSDWFPTIRSLSGR